MKSVLWIFLAGTMFLAGNLHAQELYVATEPASNMARGSVGIRLANEGMFGKKIRTRTNLEVMAGLHKNLMLHGNLYLSDLYQKQQQLEAWSFYGKYRFLSIDSIQRHFRGSVYARYASSNNPLVNEEINLEGDNTGLQGGVVFTQLLHKLALSASANYTRAMDNRGYALMPGQPRESIGYTFSTGYLLFPKVYRDYGQTNMNLYLEFLGKSNPGKGQHLMDLAPAIQFIFASKLRVDVSQRLQLWNNMQRSTKNMYLVRVEYNLFSVF